VKELLQRLLRRKETPENRGPGPFRRSRSFALLEVVIGMVILGIALSAILRSYTSSLKAISRDRTITRAVLLAQGLLDDFEVEAPEEDSVEADFGPDFPNFSYTAQFEPVEIKYRHLDIGLGKQEFEPLRKVTLRIYHRPPSGGEPKRVLEIQTYLTGIEKYAPEAKFYNALF